MNKNNFLITGASCSLGSAFLNELSNRDCKVIATSRRTLEVPLDPDVLQVPDIDLTDDNDLDRLSQVLDSEFDYRFHVINCTGHFPGYVDVVDTKMQEAKQVFDGNVLAVIGAATKFIPMMARLGGGHFIAFSSHTVYQHYPKLAAFTAAKAALESLIKGIANEYSGVGIVANTFALATLLTELEKKMKPKGDFANWLNPESVANTVVKFVQENNNLVNGNTIHLFKHSETYFRQSYFERITV